MGQTEVRMTGAGTILRWDELYTFLKGEQRTGVTGSCASGRIAPKGGHPRPGWRAREISLDFRTIPDTVGAKEKRIDVVGKSTRATWLHNKEEGLLEHKRVEGEREERLMHRGAQIRCAGR